MLARPASRRPWTGHLLSLLLILLACQRSPSPPPTPAAGPAPAASPPTAASAAPIPSPSPLRGLPVRDPFPAATTTVANGQALLWSPWAMEGRDPQRSGRSSTVGISEPRAVWSAAIDQPSFGQPALAPDGTVYVGTATGKLQSFTPAGQPAWTFATTGPVPSPALGPDGALYLRGGDGTLLALQADGRRRWTTDIGAPPAMLGPAPLVGPDSYAYLTSYHSSLVYLVQPGGFFEWAYNAKSRTLGGVAVGVDGLIYFGTADGKFRALDRELAERWTFDAGGPVMSSPAIGPDGTIYVLVGGDGGGLTALDLAGRKLWSSPPCWEPGAPLLWPAVAADGQVQVANCAIGRDGRARWKAPLAGPWATPAAIDADGNVFFGSGRILTSFAPDGTPRWSFVAEGEVGPPSLGAFGTVVFSSKSADRLYLLGR